METLFGVLVPITLFAGIFLTIVFLRKYENEERMAMIEKGMEPNTRRKTNGFGTLRFSLLSIGIGLGIIVGLIIMQFVPEPAVHEAVKIVEEGSTEVSIHGGGGIAGAVYSGTIFLFGGAGLLLAYLIYHKRKEREKEK
ncbi:MAG: hypothetical protein PHR81_06690 [Bacteroidales bacterium]|jgi:hypothetical protein|nr:hypothetical protein [Bacteroidales bacterium]MDD4214482.1 hypothetical protein [Bacteroidales bacterium]